MLEPGMGRGLLAIALGAGALAGVACAPAEPPSAPGRAEARAEQRNEAKPASPPWPGYTIRGRGSASQAIDLDDGTRLEIIDERRVLFHGATGAVLGTATAPRAVRRLVRAPAALGGGHLFVGSAGVHVASSPLGETSLRSSIAARDISFGAGALVSLQEGGQLRLDLASGKTSAPTPVGVAGYGLAAGGLVAALLEGGAVHVSRDGGRTFEPLQPPVGRAVVDIASTDGPIRLVDEEQRAWALDERGLREAPPPKPPPPGLDPRWTSGEAPLEAVAKDGAPVGGGRAVVARKGSVFEIDLASGAIAHVESGVLPPGSTCVATALSSETLFACPDDGRLAIFTRPAKGGVKLERTFQISGRIVRGGGDALLFTGPCEGARSDPGLLCVREKANTWHPIDRSASFAAKPAPNVLAWVPTSTSAFALLGGAVVGVLDAKTGERTVLEGADAQRFQALVGSERREAIEHRFRWEGGAIEGWAQDGSNLRIFAGGKRVEVGGFRFSGSRTAGPRALVTGPDGQLWQSLDWGRTFSQVASPPLRIGSPHECGEAGCLFSRWIRAGWATDAQPPVAPDPPAPSIAQAPRPRVPVLSCATSGAQSRRAVGPDTVAGLGAVTRRETDPTLIYRIGPDDPAGRASTTAQVAATESGPPINVEGGGLGSLGATRNLRFLLPFDPTATIRTSTVRLGELVDASHAAGATPPDASALSGTGLSFPVLAPRGADDGLLLIRDTGLALWAGGKTTRVVAMVRPDLDFGNPVGAASLAGDTLAVLFSESDGASHVLKMGAGRAELVLQARATRIPEAAPRSLDALGVDDKGGLAILRFPAATPPDEASPALLLRPGAAPSRLAAWSTLAVDGSPGCEGTDGVRAVLTVSPPWVQLGPSVQDDGRTLARVRWSERRVCLEAIEATGSDLETPNGSVESRLVATWGKEPRAGLVVVAEGVELREPRTCALLR